MSKQYKKRFKKNRQLAIVMPQNVQTGLIYPERVVYCYCALVAHILSLPDNHESTTVVPSELNEKGVSQAD